MMSDKIHPDKVTLYLITKPTMQSNLLLQSLKKRFYNHSQILENHIIDGTIFLDNDILLVDIMALDSDSSQLWTRALSRNSAKFKVIILNATPQVQQREITRWPMISGMFDTVVNEETLIDGINAVLHGEQCFPKAVSQYIVQQLSLTNPKWNNNVDLTIREREILGKLRQGASNSEIAQLLFISENTVKTHLYNLFKKLSVKNRTQAVFWAEKNMH